MKPYPFPRAGLAVLACLSSFSLTAAADNVVPDDQVVQGSLCVGLDCVDGEAFGFDTVRLKENNLAIDFEDTSLAAFPSNDWGIRINDSASGGDNYFMIQDRGVDGTSADSVFRIDAGADGAVTLGFGSTASGAHTVSVGATGNERRITHVGDAIDGTDAVNLAQMNAAIAAVGGGVSAADVAAGDATTLAAAAANAGAGDAATLAAANANASAGDAATLAAANAYASEGDAQTLERANAHSDEGDSRTYAAAAAYADQVGGEAVATANGYADTRAAVTLGSARSYTDARVDELAGEFSRFQSDVWEHVERTDKRIDRSGAMNSAMAHMVANAAGGRTERGRMAVGIGTQNGQGAVSIGYGRKIGERTSLTLGGAVSGSDSSAGVGLGFDL